MLKSALNLKEKYAHSFLSRLMKKTIDLFLNGMIGTEMAGNFLKKHKLADFPINYH